VPEPAELEIEPELEPELERSHEPAVQLGLF
jgi:hypothetical protein